MSIKRHKQDKIEAQLRRAEQYTYLASTKSTTPSFSKPQPAHSADNLMHYDSNLIRLDLKKTVIASLVVFGILVALYFQL